MAAAKKAKNAKKPAAAKAPKKASAKKGKAPAAKAPAEKAPAEKAPAKAVAKRASTTTARTTAAATKTAAKTATTTAAKTGTATKAAAKRPAARKSAAKGPGATIARAPRGELLDALRVPAGPVDLSAFDSRATPGFSGKKTDGKGALAEVGAELSDWQERLYAEGRKGGSRSLLLVLQGMDTSGKGGVIRHSAGQMDPQGLRITSFKAPTAIEKRRGFLWRIRQALPAAGYIGIFDRSHYEDVLIARVRELVTPAVWNRRYDQINEFEQELAARGVTVLKCFLHVSAEEQKARLEARLDDPTKHWKYNPADVDERQHWPAYAEAYQAAIERCNGETAPWHVIPSDRKWYRNWAITKLLLETLTDLDPQWPAADFDLETEKKRVAESSIG